MFWFIIIILLGIVWLYYRRLPSIGTTIKQDSIVLITGGCMGIGRQMCLLLAAKHCTIIVIDIRDDLSVALAEQVTTLGGKLIFYRCDISNLMELQHVVKSITDKHRIDILINNAGVVKMGLAIKQSIDDVLLVNNVNYIAPIQIIKLVLPIMEQQHNGHIVNVGSVLSVLPALNVASYVASKHALLGFHNCLRMELQLQQSPIKTTFIAPWGINTGMFKGAKYRFEYLIPMLDEKYVARIIINSIQQGKQEVSIPSYYLLLVHLIYILLPTTLIDKIVLFMEGDFIGSMVGRQ